MAKDIEYSREQMIASAQANGYGVVEFEFRKGIPTGQQIEVGYVFCAGRRELFCKRTGIRGFHYCNQFRIIDGSDK